MEFGQHTTALEPPIQYDPNGDPSGKHLAPKVFDCFHVLLELFLLLICSSPRLRV